MRILVADQNSLLLAAITATFGQTCDVVTATRRDACLAQVEQQRFDVVIACDKLADYTGLELLSEVPVISPDSLLIFAADPKRLSQLGKRLAVFGLFDTITYPLTPQKLVDVLKRARETLSARGLPKVRHVVLESEWDTGERLGLVEQELQADGQPEAHEEWAKASEAAAAPGQGRDDADDFVFAGPPPAVQAMGAPPRPDARGDGRARTFEATPVAATQYEVKPAIPALGHESRASGEVSDGDGADDFVFAVEPDPVAALEESAIELEAATAAEGGEPGSSDEPGNNDPVFEGSEPAEWAEDGAANDTAFGRMPVEPASWRRGGTGNVPPGLLRRTSGAAGALGQPDRDYESRETHARNDRAPANAYPVKALRGDVRSSAGDGSRVTHTSAGAGRNAAGGSQQPVDAGRASHGVAGSADAKASQSNGTGRSSYLEEALAANLAAHANFGQEKRNKARTAAGSAQSAGSAQAAGSALSGKSAQPAKQSQASKSTQPESAQPAEPAQRVTASQAESSSQPATSSQSAKSSQQPIQPEIWQALGSSQAEQAPSSKRSTRRRMRTQAVPSASQLAAFERAVARRNSGETPGVETAAANDKAMFAGMRPSKSLSELAKMASSKRPLGTAHLNNLAVPKKTVFAVSSGVAAALILGVLSFELLRNSGEEAERHMPHPQAQNMQVFSPAPTMLAKGDGNAAQLAAPPPTPAEEQPTLPPGAPIQPQAIEYDPNTAPPDPPPPPVLEHPGPMEPPQPPYTREYTETKGFNTPDSEAQPQ